MPQKRQMLQEQVTTLFLFFLQFNFWWDSSYYIELEFGQLISELLLFLGMFCLIIRWIADSTMRTKSFFYFIILLLIVGISALVSRKYTVVKMLLYGMALKDINQKKILYKFYQINLFCTLFIIFSSALGIIRSRVVFSPVWSTSLGFLNPNLTALVCFSIVLCYNYLHYEKIKITSLVIEIVFTIGVYRITTSRAGALGLALMILLVFIDKYIIKICEITKYKSVQAGVFLLFPALSLLSYLIAAFYLRSGILIKLNQFFSWRFGLWNRYINLYDVTLFGSLVDSQTVGTLDNGYLMLIYHYGLAVWFIYGMIFYIVAKRAFLHQNSYTIILILVYEAYLLFEAAPIQVNVNIIVISFLCMLWEKQTYALKKEQ